MRSCQVLNLELSRGLLDFLLKGVDSIGIHGEFNRVEGCHLIDDVCIGCV